jgi:hypothetical protein
MVLRDAAGLVVDSLNYGGLVDPWAAEGHQAAGGTGLSGCRVTAPGSAADGANRSAGRFPDGADTDSNCTDFRLQAATTLPVASAVGATNIKVAGVADFSAGQTIIIDTGANRETAVIATVGTPGASTVGTATSAGAQVSGSGITLSTALTRAHEAGAQVAASVPTPGAPNQYSRRRN